jgi:glycerophosphoryl diester phosphodiesterase
MPVTNPTRVVAHRGASLAAPENTVAAVERAAALQADGVEVDLRRARDGTIVVIHDPTVDRTTAGSGAVADLDRHDLAALGVPTLDDVMAAAGDLGLWVNLEVKEDEPDVAAALGRVIFPHGGIVSSFFTAALDRVAVAAPHLDRALLTLTGLEPSEFIDQAAAHQAWNPFFFTVTAEPGCVASAQRRGLAVHVWTVDDPDVMRACAAAGADSIITNDPARAREVLCGGC